MSAPVASGRTVVRVVPASAVDDQATSDVVSALRDRLDAEVPDARIPIAAASR